MSLVLTIGVCVRNSEAFIQETIESIQGQDFPHELTEVIFVDDGSEDRTMPLIMDNVSKMDMQTKIFHNEWKGLGWVRNVVVENARGEYILWVDGDMILPSDHARKQVDFMQQNPEVGIAKAKYGTCPEENLVSALEKMTFMAFDSKFAGGANPKVLGTGGSIYRVKAIKQVGGFDPTITGTGEDMDAEHRVRNTGWLLYRGTPAIFYERFRKTWKDIWGKKFWHGYGVHYIFKKNRGQISLYRANPPAAFLTAVWISVVAYRLMHRKWVFLLPVQYTFKKIAWGLGFLKGQVEH